MTSPHHSSTSMGRLRFVGRVPERAQLESDLASAIEDRFRVVLLTGEPGVGKTRLASELLDKHRRDCLVLTSRGYPMGATASLGVWVEALDRRLRALDAAQIERLSAGVADDLAALLPSVAAVIHSSRPGEPPPGEPPRIRILSALAVLLERLAGDQPVLVQLDDAHLADGSSWEALSYLAHNLSSSRVLVIAIARPVELSGHAAALEVLSALEQEDHLVRRTLMPLPDADVAELTAAVVGSEATNQALVAWVSGRARGNPLFAVGLLRALVDEGADLAHPALRHVPETLAARIEARMSGLEVADRATIEMLATLGYRARTDELAVLCGQPPGELALILDRLVRLRLIDEQTEGAEITYELAHPLIAEAAYDSIGGARRQALHRHLARALVSAGRPGAAAAHFVRSAPVGDEEAVSTLVAGFRQAEERELTREAMTILDGLLQLLPGGDTRWVAVFEAMRPQAPWIVDHRTDVGASTGIRAMLIIEQVLEASPDKVQRAMAKFNLASFLAWGNGDLAAARQKLEDAYALLDEAGLAQGALLAANELGYLAGLEGNLVEHERIAREILARAEADGETFVVLQALCSLALALLWGGKLAEAFPFIDQGLAIARADHYLYRVTYLLALLGFADSLAGGSAGAEGRMVEAMAGNPAYRDTLLPDLHAACHWMSGNLAEGAGWAVELSGWLTSGAVSRRRSFGAVFAALCLLELGRVAQAKAMLDQASIPFGTSRWWLYGHLLAWAGAVSRWRSDPSFEALATLSDAADSIVAVGGSLLAPLVVADLAEAAADCSDAAAAGHAVELQARLDVPDTSPFAGLAAVVATSASMTLGDRAEAAASARQAAGAFARAGWQLWQGRALALGARALAGHDDHQAVELLDAASNLFDELSATPRSQQLEATRTVLARRGRKSPRTKGVLSVRELEVARLAAEGLSARDIGQRLFIGTRTVETHLANVYVKLGVKSRLELARRLPTVDT